MKYKIYQRRVNSYINHTKLLMFMEPERQPLRMAHLPPMQVTHQKSSSVTWMWQISRGAIYFQVIILILERVLSSKVFKVGSGCNRDAVDVRLHETWVVLTASLRQTCGSMELWLFWQCYCTGTCLMWLEPNLLSKKWLINFVIPPYFMWFVA